MFDIVIKHGKIVDGTGSPWFIADIGIKQGKIEKIGVIEPEEGKSLIDANGLVVSPGFVDIHSHSDFILPLSTFTSVSSFVMNSLCSSNPS